MISWIEMKLNHEEHMSPVFRMKDVSSEITIRNIIVRR